MYWSLHKSDVVTSDDNYTLEKSVYAFRENSNGYCKEDISDVVGQIFFSFK